MTGIERPISGPPVGVFALLGLPGAGKGVQSASLREQHGYRVISTGELFRKAMREQSPLGLQVKSVVERGELVQDELTIALVEEALGHNRKGVIFDGVPRSVQQAQALDEIVRLDAALFLEVPPAVIESRLVSRRICTSAGHALAVSGFGDLESQACPIDGSALKRRADDDSAVIRRRLERQSGALEAVRSHYDLSHRLVGIDGNRSPGEVTTAILEALETCPSAAAQWRSRRNQWILGVVE